MFDAHGNVTTSGNQTLVFDGANRHVSSTAAGTTVTYVRDASNRIVSRAVNLDYGWHGTAQRGLDHETRITTGPLKGIPSGQWKEVLGWMMPFRCTK